MEAVERVEARRVDDRGVAHARAGPLDLDVAHAARGDVVEALQEGVDVVLRHGGDAAVAVVYAGAAAGAAAEDVDRGGRREHAHRRDDLAEQRVDEGALAGRELAHHRDRQRAGEALARGDHGGQGVGHADDRDAEDPARDPGEQRRRGGQQVLEAVVLKRLRELGEQRAGAVVLGRLGEDLDEVLLRGLGEAGLQAGLGGGEGALATEDAEALGGVAEGGDLVGAEGAAEVGLAAEARRRTGLEVLGGALVAVVEAAARLHEAQLLRGRGDVALQALADHGDGAVGEHVGAQDHVGELVEVLFLAVARGRDRGVDEGVDHRVAARGRRRGAADRPAGDLGQRPQALALRALQVLLEVAQRERARLGTCPEAQVDPDPVLVPLRAGGDPLAGRFGAEAVAAGRQREAEVGARGRGRGVDVERGVAGVGLGAEPGERVVGALLGEQQARALADQQRAQRATCPFGQAGAGALELEQGALVAAAPDLQQRD